MDNSDEGLPGVLALGNRDSDRRDTTVRAVPRCRGGEQRHYHPLRLPCLETKKKTRRECDVSKRLLGRKSVVQNDDIARICACRTAPYTGMRVDTRLVRSGNASFTLPISL